MKWFRPAVQMPWEWHKWFAWHPVAIPNNVYKDRYVIWWEWVERKFDSNYADSFYIYREIQK